MSHLQQFLRIYPNPLEHLTLPEFGYNIKINRSKTFPNLVQFSYDQIESPKLDPIVCECRGAILDESNNWEYVARPFDRFFNYGELCVTEVDWNTAKVSEKLDGSLIIMYYYRGVWWVATRGSADASGVPNGTTSTFAELFWETTKEWFPYVLLKPNRTYIFELMTPFNRVVCGYEKSQSKLIAIRENNGWEYPIEWAPTLIPKVQTFPITSFEEVVNAAAILNPLRQEGFVVSDAHGRRVKVKSPAYVALHHLRDGSLDRRLMELVQSGLTEGFPAFDILADFPEEMKLYQDMKAKVDDLILQTEQKYDTIKGIENQKEFALEAVKLPSSAAMFMVRKGKCESIAKYFLTMPTDKLLDCIK